MRYTTHKKCECQIQSDPKVTNNNNETHIEAPPSEHKNNNLLIQ